MILYLIACLALTGCARRDAPVTRTVFAMDTVMNLTVYGKNGAAALDAAEQELYRLDAHLARGTEGSAVYALNRDGTVIDRETAELLQTSGDIAQATGGAFDPTVAELLELWGFGSGAGEHRVPSQEEIDAALAHAGAKHVHIDGEQVILDLPAQLDLGGVAKGCAGERVEEILRDRGITGAVLDLGGDVALLGSKGSAWRIAVKDPAAEGAYLGVLETDGDRFIMTSGVYERYFEENGVRYHHILDPKTGCPADSDLVSATVICADGVWADALATACCVLGAEGSLELRKTAVPFDVILVTVDGRVLYTCDGFAPAAEGYTYEQVA
ncbi:MAG: FAD:protein FMN transferase [Oscillospiraceae bacterium]|nr:FAD:protein FMN transferase [Oscillospiraceae bacterium]